MHQIPPEIDTLQRRSLLVGIAGLAACAIGALASPDQFFRSYLLAYVFWINIALGCLAIVMLHHLSGGAWGIIIRRLLESATRTLPLMAILFLPLALGLPRLYGWADPRAVARDEVLQHKQPYLNVPFFLGRAVLYFAVWIGVGHLLNKWSLEQDERPPQPDYRHFRLLSAPGLMLYGLTATFASVDWVMSLDSRWFSTIFGILFMGGQGLAALSFTITMLLLLAHAKPFADVLSAEHLHDLGKLLFAFVMLWAYFAFSQFLIIWSGNLPEEIPWYLRRLQGGWQWVAALIVLGHFVLPFLLLLSRGTKRNTRALARVAIAIVVMRFVDLFWMIEPQFREGRVGIHWMDVAAAVGVGGLWLWCFAWQLKGRPLLPVNDPYLHEMVGHAQARD